MESDVRCVFWVLSTGGILGCVECSDPVADRVCNLSLVYDNQTYEIVMMGKRNVQTCRTTDSPAQAPPLPQTLVTGPVVLGEAEREETY